MILVLGSESIFRKQLMEQAGFEFEVIPANIDEKAIRDDDPKELVRKLGVAKSEQVLQNINLKADFCMYNNAIIITSDQVAVRESDGEILEKPLTSIGLPDTDLAKRYLRSLIDSRVIFYTSLVCSNRRTNLRTTQVVINEVTFAPFSETEISELVSIGLTFKACGALPSGLVGARASEIVDSHIETFSGDATAMVGLPMNALKSYLRASGYPVMHPEASPLPASSAI